jgi:hypothetical protein
MSSLRLEGAYSSAAKREVNGEEKVVGVLLDARPGEMFLASGVVAIHERRKFG